MSISLNEEDLTLTGTCDQCGAALYCIEIETGHAVCSNPECEAEETFDPHEFTEGL